MDTRGGIDENWSNVMSWKLLLACIIVHLILLYSIFDVYYTSPVIQGIQPHFLTNAEPPAKRIVIFSADGLRYDTFNENPDKSPYLHQIIRERQGISGLSLSSVPTESRPGHVAIFAGITEDISAVAKGWKKNPVKFDSVFNRSTNSYLWGSPDIVGLFDDLQNVRGFSYNEDEEDFGSNDAWKLDDWVFKNFEKFLAGLKAHKEEKLKFEEPGNVMFLHLLGIDTNGHGNKPHSTQYIENIRVVDDGIGKTAQLISEYFNDSKTAFIFTSDHGMTDWGSHGAGTNQEVLTPFLAWGAGIRKGGARVTINQIDLAALISILIGKPIPVNSMGVLPIHVMENRESSMKYEFRASLANFLQLKEQIIALRDVKSHRFWFHQFPEFNDKSMASLESEMLKLARARRFEAACSLFSDKSHLLKKAIVFYHRYDRNLLGNAISLTFATWILLIFAMLTQESAATTKSHSPENWRTLALPNKFFAMFLGLAAIFAVYCGLSISQSVYVMLPVYLLAVLENFAKISTKLSKFSKSAFSSKKLLNIDFLVKPFLGFVGISVIILIFVLTFIDRKFLSLVFGMLLFLPYAYSTPIVGYWSKTWRLLCISLLPFPFLPAVGISANLPICIISPLLLSIVCEKIAKCAIFRTRNRENLRFFAISNFLVAIFIFLVHFLFEKPPHIARILSWISIPWAFLAPNLMTQRFLVDRLVAYALAFYIPYSLLSISYESLFVLLFLPLLALFLRFEFGHLSDVELFQIANFGANFSPPPNSNFFVEIRRAIVCVSFVLCTLFGTGNFASINSFNPSTLNLFISVFSPFTMAFLLIIKLLLPILCVSLTFSAICRFEKLEIRRLCCTVLILTDFMSMCFFHQLKDEGSWLEIGMSISQYIVSMCISLALLILLSLSTSMMSFDFWIIFEKKKKRVEEVEKCDEIQEEITENLEFSA
ncbi:unnamed protein product [Caenorhabditis angaria]|uniref:GPI ethanolamine phosphate transferase 1 n=1 Tax=Caenorhabditis angaria TaxID=860376 RepID=A0A9P1I8V6_9PELO|nr:unnamed protein product [Caenorhabditis angaria]